MWRQFILCKRSCTQPSQKVSILPRNLMTRPDRRFESLFSGWRMMPNSLTCHALCSRGLLYGCSGQRLGCWMPTSSFYTGSLVKRSYASVQKISLRVSTCASSASQMASTLNCRWPGNRTAASRIPSRHKYSKCKIVLSYSSATRLVLSNAIHWVSYTHAHNPKDVQHKHGIESAKNFTFRFFFSSTVNEFVFFSRSISVKILNDPGRVYVPSITSCPSCDFEVLDCQ